MLTIDGRRGEGGGQVLRTSLSLSVLTGKPFTMTHIRANRSRPGLRPQHLTAVYAAAALCQAELTGARVDSTHLTFVPTTPIQPINLTFDVRDAAQRGSAGSVTLIYQALLWPLLFAPAESHVTLRGGTHVAYSPSYHYLAEVAQPAFARFGVMATLALDKWGWYPIGKGQMRAAVTPLPAGTPLQAVAFAPSPKDAVTGIAVASNLPAHIPQRMAGRAVNLLTARGMQATITPQRLRGPSRGAGIFLAMPQAGFMGLGAKGLPSDKVAENAVAELNAFVDNVADVGLHLADQLLLPMALARGTSSLTTHCLSEHTLTNVALIQEWLGVDIVVTGRKNEPGQLIVQGVGWTC